MMYSIADIEKIYPNWYNSSHSLSKDDQKFIWENTPLPKDEEERLRNITKTSEQQDVNLSGNVNGTYKLNTNVGIILSKGEAILLLRKCEYKTAPKIVASYLETLFSKWPSYKGHWLFIAQHYTPKTINCLITQIIKRTQRGEYTIKNLASYFTDTILRYRPMRKKFRGMKFRIKPKEMAI